MNTSDFYYELPEDLIAQDPLEQRSMSRLLVLDRCTGSLSHRHFYDILEYFNPGDCLVLNDSKVIPARLYGTKDDTGAKVEVLLLKRLSDTDWECLVRPGRKLRKGAGISFGKEPRTISGGTNGTGTPLPLGVGSGGVLLHGKILDVLPDGNRLIHFSFEGIFEEILYRLGEMPIPPYIHKPLKEKERYNTVYAKWDGSAAAPTAGLHWTKELLTELSKKGVEIVYVTLHVGLGTFRPVKVGKIENHKMHSEYYSISDEAAKTLNRVRSSGGRLICTGTTSCRVLESAALPDGPDVSVKSGSGFTDIFIYPGYNFKFVNALITNFHLPESTLLMLVSAFAGRENVMKAYKAAIKEKYRFYSFGDAMFII